MARRDQRDLVAHGLLAVTALLAAAPLVVDRCPRPSSYRAFELRAWPQARSRSSRARYGRGSRSRHRRSACRSLAFAGARPRVRARSADRFLWPERRSMVPASPSSRIGVATLCLAALASPYCFAPRPFARSVTRPGPIMFAMSIAAIGAVATRFAYPEVAKIGGLAFGVDVGQGPDPRLALYAARVRDAGVDVGVVVTRSRRARRGRRKSAWGWCSSSSAATASAGRITICCRCSGLALIAEAARLRRARRGARGVAAQRRHAADRRRRVGGVRRRGRDRPRSARSPRSTA